MARICTAGQGAVSEAQSLFYVEIDVGVRSAQSATSKVVTATDMSTFGAPMLATLFGKALEATACLARAWLRLLTMLMLFSISECTSQRRETGAVQSCFTSQLPCTDPAVWESVAAPTGSTCYWREGSECIQISITSSVIA